MKPRLATPPPEPEEVLSVCQELGLQCDVELARPLAAYLGALQKWNKRMNLVGPDSWRQMLTELCADSWHLAEFLRGLELPENPRCMDLGAGAGLPGIPLRMIWREGSYTLVELRQKRALFLGQVLAIAPLPGVDVFEGRAEDALAEHAPLNLVLSRAFMPWPRLLDLVEPHLDSGGLLVIMANEAPPEELPDAWRLEAASVYDSNGRQRHFWALARKGFLEKLL